MQRIFIWITTITVVWSTIQFTNAEKVFTPTSMPLIESGTNSDEYDNESARKIIGSRVVTSVSVVMNGKEPQFADAVGNYVPRPLVPPRVASPVSLLDPDRYEFYTFNDEGELVKRLMTMDEIQSIVANGDSEQQQVLAKTPTVVTDNEADIRSVVNNVQKVLHREMSQNQNFTANLVHNKLDTPDTSSSWSSILPAIFGNTGEPIVSNKMPITTGSTADSVILQSTSKKPTSHKTTNKVKTPTKTTSSYTKQKPKPTSNRPSSSYGTTQKPHSTTAQKNKHTSSGTTTKIQNNVKNTLTPGISTFTPKPTKLVTVQRPATAHIQKVSHGSSATSALNRIATTVVQNTSPTKPLKTSHPTKTTVKITSAPSFTSYETKTTTPIETKPTKKNRIPETTFITTTTTKKKPSTTKQKLKTTTPVPASKYTTSKSSPSAAASTIKYETVKFEPTTRKTSPLSPIHPTTLAPKESPSVDIGEPEPDNVFDSELSLNQIIESLKDLEGTTMPYPQKFSDLMDLTTLNQNLIDKLNTEAVMVYNNGEDTTTKSYMDSNDFKQSMSSTVSYIPQTTSEYPHTSPGTESYNRITTNTRPIVRQPSTMSVMKVQHKESDDDMDSVLEEKTTTDLSDITTTDSSDSKQHTSAMDNILRESFDSVLSQVQNEQKTTTMNDDDVETTTFIDESTKTAINDKKKVIYKPSSFITMADEESGTESMQYFEKLVEHYVNEKNRNNTVDEQTSTQFTESTATTEALRLMETEPSTEQESLTTTMPSDDTSENAQKEENESTTMEQEDDDMQLALRTENSFEPSQSNEATTEGQDFSTIQFIEDQTERQEPGSTKRSTDKSEEMSSSTQLNDFIETTSLLNDEEKTDNPNTERMMDGTTTVWPDNVPQFDEETQAQYEMVQLIEKIAKNLTEERTTLSPIERKEDTTQNVTMNREDAEADLGETQTKTYIEIRPYQKKTDPTKAPTKSSLSKLKVPTLAPILNNLKMKVVNALKNTNTIHLDPAPKQALGLEESTANAGEDILEFTRFCNEVAFNFWNVLNNDGGISSARSLVLSPFALTSMLAMLFLGARGRTSGEINDMLHLDDIVTFNPHAIFRNISEISSDGRKNENIHTSAFVRELLSDRSKGKILSFFKEKVQQFYSGYVEEVNFTTVNDIIRRRTNLLIKRHTGGKVNEYLKTSNVWVKPPLSGISANIFETDCSKASKTERDGEMFFQVLPAIRSRRLVPIPAVVWKSGFTAGYDPELDATAVAIGLSKNTVSTIFVMPGQQGHSAPGDNLERLESVLMVNAVSKNAWRRLLATLMERPGLEVQIPRFTHRSFVNATNALRKLGLETIFDQSGADLRGITGSITRDMFVSDLIQINTFSTCGEDKLPEEHHVEMYPAPPNKHRNVEYSTPTSPITPDFESDRAFADPLFDLKYLNLPLPLRPRQARIPETPRLRFDKPFIYFVRHNPTGMVLFFGRFNPRLLP